MSRSLLYVLQSMTYMQITAGTCMVRTGSMACSGDFCLRMSLSHLNVQSLLSPAADQAFSDPQRC